MDAMDAINEIMGPPIPTAKVYKETPVKPDQQHPVAKGGHYRLWHEHVWPHGYTPQRMEEVKNLDYSVYAGAELIPNNGTMSPEDYHAANHRYGRSIINRHLARSTIPIEHLKQIQRGLLDDKLHFSLVDELNDGLSAGSYASGSHTIKIAIPEESTELSEHRAITHEVGHAVDAVNRPSTYGSESLAVHVMPSAYKYGYGAAHPKLEGIAEGYSLGHSRITRQGRRVGGNREMGYIPSGWEDPNNADKFRSIRNRSFHEARGVPMNPPRTEPTPEVEPQPGLFD